MMFWVKLLILLAIANVILIPIEWYRFRHSVWSWRGFIDNGMLGASYIVVFLDLLVLVACVLVPIIYWILSPEWL